MKRTLSVLGASLLFCLATAGTAAADGFGTLLGQTQTSSQSQSGSNSVSQDATSGALSVTGAQLNLNAPINLLSSGGDGSVSQSNDSSATSSASNKSTAVQVVDQAQQSSQTQNGQQMPGCGCDGGKDGALLEQDQASSQSQQGSNSVDQDASSKAISVTGAQVNLNAPISLLSHGGGGPVSQSNDASATSSASNMSYAKQVVGQEQSSTQAQDGRQGRTCGCQQGGGGQADPQQSQTSTQSQDGSNSVDQDARSKAISVTGAQLNVNAPISLLSHGGGGPVSQSNDSSATSSASNESTAIQWIDQSQKSSQSHWGNQQLACCNHGGKQHGCGCQQGKGPLLEEDQASDQRQSGSNSVSQNAKSKAISVMGAQLNVNAPVSFLSGHHGCGCKGKGKSKGGDVRQTNTSAADSSASNKSWAVQRIGQWQAAQQRQWGLQRL